jgi:hypothetical protein
MLLSLATSYYLLLLIAVARCQIAIALASFGNNEPPLRAARPPSHDGGRDPTAVVVVATATAAPASSAAVPPASSSSLVDRDDDDPADAAVVDVGGSCSYRPPRRMVAFRPPSRHTYGFAATAGGDDGDCDGDCDYDDYYDLPEIELRALLLLPPPCRPDDGVGSDERDGVVVAFVPVGGTTLVAGGAPRDGRGDGASPGGRGGGAKSGRNRRTKKMAAAKGGVRSVVRGDDRSLHWIECADGGRMPSDEEVSAAASRAVLTHATFSIDECIVVVIPPNIAGIVIGDDRSPPPPSSSIVVEAPLDRVDVIDMSNPNMSRNDRARLTDEILRSIDDGGGSSQRRLRNWISTITASSSHDADGGGRQPVLLVVHRDFPPPRTDDRMPQIGGDDDRAPHRRRRCCALLFLGHRTSIGPAGTRGAPGRTTRRTHRGSLKEYALKNRGTSDAAADARLASTAMEPEIGFLMANLALAGVVWDVGRDAGGGGTAPDEGPRPVLRQRSASAVRRRVRRDGAARRRRFRSGRMGLRRVGAPRRGRREIVAAGGLRGRGRLESLVDGRVVHPRLVRCYSLRSSLQHRCSGPRGWAGFAA